MRHYLPDHMTVHEHVEAFRGFTYDEIVAHLKATHSILFPGERTASRAEMIAMHGELHAGALVAEVLPDPEPVPSPVTLNDMADLLTEHFTALRADMARRAGVTTPAVPERRAVITTPGVYRVWEPAEGDGNNPRLAWTKFADDPNARLHSEDADAFGALMAENIDARRELAQAVDPGGEYGDLEPDELPSFKELLQVVDGMRERTAKHEHTIDFLHDTVRKTVREAEMLHSDLARERSQTELLRGDLAQRLATIDRLNGQVAMYDAERIELREQLRTAVAGSETAQQEAEHQPASAGSLTTAVMLSEIERLNTECARSLGFVVGYQSAHAAAMQDLADILGVERENVDSLADGIEKVREVVRSQAYDLKWLGNFHTARVDEMRSLCDRLASALSDDATALELRPRIVPRTPDQARTDAPDSPDAIEAALIEAERLAAVGRRRNRWNFLTRRSIARRLDAVDATNANSRRQLEQLRHLEAVDQPPTWANDLASPPNT